MNAGLAHGHFGVPQEYTQANCEEPQDVLILAEMRKGPLSGYDVVTFVHDRFCYLASSGTMYSVLYPPLGDGLISGVSMQRKRVYKLPTRERKY